MNMKTAWEEVHTDTPPEEALPAALPVDDPVEEPVVTVNEDSALGLAELLLKNPGRVERLNRDQTRLPLLVPRFLIIALAIAFKVLGANSHNTIVSADHDGGKALAKAFDDMFKIDGANATLALNWGIALVVYLVIGLAVARFVARLAAIRPVARRRRPVAHG